MVSKYFSVFIGGEVRRKLGVVFFLFLFRMVVFVEESLDFYWR